MIQTDLSSFSYKKGSLLPWCKICGTQHFYRNGKNKAGIQRYLCRKCGFRFVWTSDLPRRNFFSSVISFAVELYTSMRMRTSLRGIAVILKKAFNLVVSHETIRQWVLDSEHDVEGNCTPSKTWHVDETYFKIKGVQHMLWIVRCRESGQVIAWHISKTHTMNDAMIVLKKAKEQSKGKRPERIITDGLGQYPKAISKTMGWHWSEHRKRHVIDSGVGLNAFIERLNLEIKRRLKWFNTFQALAWAKAFFGLWFYHFNTQYLT